MLIKRFEEAKSPKFPQQTNSGWLRSSDSSPESRKSCAWLQEDYPGIVRFFQNEATQKSSRKFRKCDLLEDDESTAQALIRFDAVISDSTLLFENASFRFRNPHRLRSRADQTWDACRNQKHGLKKARPFRRSVRVDLEMFCRLGFQTFFEAVWWSFEETYENLWSSKIWVLRPYHDF